MQNPPIIDFRNFLEESLKTSSENTCITTLDLRDHPITEDNAKIILEMLDSRLTLEEVYLADAPPESRSSLLNSNFSEIKKKTLRNKEYQYIIKKLNDIKFNSSISQETGKNDLKTLKTRCNSIKNAFSDDQIIQDLLDNISAVETLLPFYKNDPKHKDCTLKNYTKEIDDQKPTILQGFLFESVSKTKLSKRSRALEWNEKILPNNLIDALENNTVCEKLDFTADNFLEENFFSFMENNKIIKILTLNQRCITNLFCLLKMFLKKIEHSRFLICLVIIYFFQIQCNCAKF